jgi:hypothetical protein
MSGTPEAIELERTPLLTSNALRRHLRRDANLYKKGAQGVFVLRRIVTTEHNIFFCQVHAGRRIHVYMTQHSVRCGR